MATYYLPSAELAKSVLQKGRGEVFFPRPAGPLAWLDPAAQPPCPDPLSKARTSHSPKGLFFPSSESLGRYGPRAQAAATAVQTEPVLLVGLRACELRALGYLDEVFLKGNFNDPTYRARREAMTILSVDCVQCAETCCCTLVGGLPYPTAGFDVNLSPLDGGFLAEAGTNRGGRWLADAGHGALSEATPELLARRDRRREQMVQQVRKQNERFTFAARDEKETDLPNDDDPSWQQFAADCVECGACTNVCPTCHCFYLYDQVLRPDDFERVRNWDSCLLSSYHRMAGTPSMKPTPRPRLRSRLANRVLHKFSYSPEQYGRLGCVGCGRCIEACLGAIDIRQVVEELSP